MVVFPCMHLVFGSVFSECLWALGFVLFCEVHVDFLVGNRAVRKRQAQESSMHYKTLLFAPRS